MSRFSRGLSEPQIVTAGLALGGGLIVFGTAAATFRDLALPSAVVPLASLGARLAIGAPVAVVSAGILVLMALPIIRLLVVMGRFWREGDWRFGLTTGMVLATVLLGLAIGSR